jgi:hypothetical protein
MQLIASRTFPFLDADSLQEFNAREALFRGQSGEFLLYLSAGNDTVDAAERVVRLDSRQALVWINEEADYCSSFWE